VKGAGLESDRSQISENVFSNNKHTINIITVYVTTVSPYIIYLTTCFDILYHHCEGGGLGKR